MRRRSSRTGTRFDSASQPPSSGRVTKSSSGVRIWLCTVLAVARTALIAGVAALLIAAPSGFGAPQGWPKTTRLRDGSTVLVWQNGRVIERDASGRLQSESYCGSYTRYTRWVRFLATFRQAVLTQDHARVAAEVAWPLSWNHGRRSTAITSRTQLLRLYDSVFTASVVRQIKLADPRALFCKNVSEVLLGQGVAWGDEPGGELAIVSINGSD
jgi:hypothetical protein